MNAEAVLEELRQVFLEKAALFRAEAAEAQAEGAGDVVLRAGGKASAYEDAAKLIEGRIK